MAGLSGMYDDNAMTQYQMMQMMNRGNRGASNPVQPALNALGMYAVMKNQNQMEKTKQEMGGLVQRFLMGDPESGNAIYEYLVNHPDAKFRKIGANINPDYFNKLLDKRGDDNWFVEAASQLSGQNFVPPEMRQKLTEGVIDYQQKIATTRATKKEELAAKKNELSDPELALLEYIKKVRESKAQYDPQIVALAVDKAIRESKGTAQAKLDVETNPQNVAAQANAASQIEAAKQNIPLPNTANNPNAGITKNQASILDQLIQNVRQDKDVKDFIDIRDGYDRVSAGANDNSAVGDMSVIFGYMKMLDPTSVVREGEQASAENARGVPERLRNIYNKMLTGQRLTPEQRSSFQNMAGRLYQQKEKQYVKAGDYYKNIATKTGLDPNMVMRDYTTNIQTENKTTQPTQEEIIAELKKRGEM